MATEDPIKRLIKRRHPEHARMLEEWKFLRQAVEGGPGYANEGNLFRHPRERADVYAARLKRAADHHYNLTGQVISTYVGYLFQVNPTASSELPDYLKAFVDRADDEGRPLLELAKDMATWCLGYGVIWVAVDKPAAPVEVVSRADEQRLDLSPYAYLVHPTHVLDGRIERGEVKWLLVQEDIRDDVDPLNSSGAMISRYRLWTPDGFLLITPKQGQGSQEEYTTAEGKHKLGRVPFVPVRYGSGCGFACPGLVADIAHLDRAIFNKTSLLDEIHNVATFPQLTYPYTGDLYEDDGQGGFKLTAEGQGVLTVGLHDVIPFNSEAGSPGYIAPPSGPAEVLGKGITDMVRLLLGLALLDGDTGTPDGGAQAAPSGVSKAYTFEKLNKRLATIAARIEAGILDVFRLVALWNGRKAEEVPPNAYDMPENFEVKALAAEIEEALTILGGAPPSSTLKAEIWKAIVRKRFPKLDEETLKKIDEEIEATLEAAELGAMALLEQGTPADPREGEDEEDEGQEKEDTDGDEEEAG